MLIIISLLALLWLQAPRLGDEFRVDGDFRSFYWMNKFRDRALFPNDPLGRLSYTAIRLPWGDVPLFAKRQVLFNCDLVSQDANLIRYALNAYYTDDPQVVIDFCETYAVDYLVLDARSYSEAYLATERIFFEPYNQELLPQLVDRDTFVLAQLTAEKRVFQSENLFVVPCEPSLAIVK